MPRLAIDASTEGRNPDDVFAALADFESYPGAAEDIHSISVTKESASTSVSVWEVAFRGGVIRWSQRDRFDPQSRTIRFDQIEGDSEVWEGTWTVSEGRVRFEVEFDMGIPSLANQLNPLAARALYDVIVAVIRGRVGTDAEILSLPPS